MKDTPAFVVLGNGLIKVKKIQASSKMLQCSFFHVSVEILQ